MPSAATKPDLLIEHHKLGKPQPKPTILFVHGIGFDKRFWEPLLGENRADWNTITYNLEAKEEQPESHAPTMESYVVQLLWVVQKCMRKGRVILCGHGLGGSIALRAMEVAPHRFKGVVIIGALPLPPNREETLEISQLLGNLTDKSGLEYIARYINESLNPESDQREKVEQNLVVHSQHSLTRLLMAQLTRVDTTSTIAESTLPLLLITGEHDTITHPRSFLEMCLNIGGAHFVRIPEAGHLCPFEEPAAVHRALQGFITLVEKATK